MGILNLNDISNEYYNIGDFNFYTKSYDYKLSDTQQSFIKLLENNSSKIIFVQKSRQVGYTTSVSLFSFNSIQENKNILHISSTSFGAKYAIDKIRGLVTKYKPSMLANKRNSFNSKEIVTNKSTFKSIFNRMVLNEQCKRYDYIFIDEYSSQYKVELGQLLAYCLPLIKVDGTIVISSDKQLYLGEEGTTHFDFTEPQFNRFVLK